MATDQVKPFCGVLMRSALSLLMPLETQLLAALRFLSFLSSVHHWPILLEAHKAARIGEQEVNSKFAKSRVNQDYASLNKCQNFTLVELKASGDQPAIHLSHSSILHVHVSCDYLNLETNINQNYFLASKPAQRVFKIQMLFPSDVLCNEAGQGVLRQRVKNAVNSLNRDWNFCSYSAEGSRECKDININVKCDHYRGNSRIKRQNNRDPEIGVYNLEANIPVER